MIKDKGTLVLLLLCAWLVAVMLCVCGCTRTVSRAVETHDTVFVATHASDSNVVVGKGYELDFGHRADSLLQAVRDSVVRASLRRDSVYVWDSVSVRERGDSVLIYKEHWNTRVVELLDTVVRVRSDTVFSVRTDTAVVVRTDTLLVYRYAERGDSAYIGSDRSKETVRRQAAFPWLKLFGLVAVGMGLLLIWRKSR